MSKADELRAELAAEEANERFVDAKRAFESGEISADEYRAVKEEFHDARVAHRQLREARKAELEAEAADGDATVTPGSVGVTTDQTTPGGVA